MSSIELQNCFKELLESSNYKSKLPDEFKAKEFIEDFVGLSSYQILNGDD